LTEGITDIDHLRAAHRRLSADGRYDYLAPSYPELTIKGSVALVHELDLIARSAPDELTIGVVDADEPEQLRKWKLEPGEFRHWGGAAYLMCLDRPSWADEAFCIEDLYLWSEASAFVDGRRLFKSSEFGEDGRTADGVYRLGGNRSSAIYVTQRVIRIDDGFSALLTKQHFAELVLARQPPFGEMNFLGFSGTFEIFRRILEHHLRRRGMLS
jgi:hypothetical protein